MKMHDRNNQQNIVSNLINDSVGELIGPATAGSLRNRRPRFRVLQDSFDGPSYFFGELGAQF